MAMVTPLLELRNLRKTFTVGPRAVAAVRDVSLTIQPGEIVGLVGESGSGKSTVANLVLGLERPDAGEILYQGRPLAELLAGSGRAYRSAVQAVFQDPVQAMDSRKTVGWSIAEPLVIHRAARGAALRSRVAELLGAVHLDPSLADRYPHQISGGQAQRANIARALALEPSLLVCDEAVSALDVSVQAQIMNLFLEIQQRLSTAMLFISHALPVVRHLADSMVVMYAGAVVEQGPTEAVCEAPRHPYTRLLIGSSLPPDPERQPVRPPSARREALPTAGCRFAPRCVLATDRCRSDDPVLSEVGSAHSAACWRTDVPALVEPVQG
ncbi:ATP-binding cassette domain-containing protein [Acrocarpospora macrocephala]|uniref:Glutathione import ATP-binding protein GsiA n=1 Tax=Acrocarpospora macrocephala TaxID=150177 RepID=A0A5M3X0M1_9ACTN|nr:ABC transporter ATP-binding protein [Acrocarpospora macrocephala]GES11828.1 ABC transporter ATP-binding protein [Acrocarpospora macrocephala]